MFSSSSKPITTERDPSFDHKAHTIVPLADVLQKKDSAITLIKQEFTKKGWCIVKLPGEKDKSNEGRGFDFSSSNYKFFRPTQESFSALSSFFALPTDAKEKAKGYASVPHKESIHITTPCMYLEKSHPLHALLSGWEALMDEVAVDLMEILCEKVFGCKKATLAHRADLPIAFGGHAGMLDVAFYKNNQTATLSPQVGFSTQDVNCVPHYDPGLLAISFLSSHDGLQLQDPSTGQWFAGPVNTEKGQEDLGVIWLGAAAVTASQGRVKPGVHRVVYPQVAVPRLTAWYEVCTVEQVNQERMQYMPEPGLLRLPNLPNSLPMKLTNTDRAHSQIERHYGVPMSKMPRRSDYFAAAYSEDLKDNDAFMSDF